MGAFVATSNPMSDQHPDDQALGQHVRSLRRARGLTQENLASRAGLSVDAVRRMEAGLYSPSMRTVVKLCHGLGLSRSTLFASLEEPDATPHHELVELLSGATPSQVELLTAITRLILGIPNA